MKLTKRILSLALAIVLGCLVAATAAASDTLPDAATTEDDISDAETNAKTDFQSTPEAPTTADYEQSWSSPGTANITHFAPKTADSEQAWPNTLTPHDHDGYLYWADVMLDDHPTLHYDTRLQQYYLAFTLSEASKLTALCEDYWLAFRLQYNVDQLHELSNVDARIWTKLSWRDKSIGEQLSEKTAAKIRSDSKLDNTMAVLQLIQESPEYRQSAKLREQVTYELDYQKSVLNEVFTGFWLISAGGAYIIYPDAEVPSEKLATWLSMSTNEVCTMVEQFMEQNPEWKVLDEVYDLVRSGTTSWDLATFEQIGSDKIGPLYNKVATLAKAHWASTFRRLEEATFAVPFPVGASFQWSDGLAGLAKSLENGALPISATAS